ncbi:hypothetical protein [Croceimicrobium hydrocarbonivorans]|uniref:Uncharacterized protein n=1 Tax=Croceimicrobium hydrocarbonivorans TaxID=2761580 RepID=A0A7H0VBB0_9FLAO|nr:hypothetical protein [Croceimicrobium hydrocarbonivorans]QNR22964.1 hypothetical protein H4K34_11300 [Croceimicrobium hydrocarbonivorans]QNR23008.1 hypothetical protein H4K34_11520 [Croceimicrobium hydrocarbonivorans]
MAGKGLFKVLVVPAGGNPINPFNNQVFSRIVVTNQDPGDSAKITINGQEDDILPGEQMDYWSQNSGLAMVVQSISAGLNDNFIIRAFT